MKFLFLHGPPASGKYTLARALEERDLCKNFHNHLTIDVAKALFDFGTENFWKLVDDLRIASLEAAASRGEHNIVFTYCYDHPNDLETTMRIKDAVVSNGSEFLPFYLSCNREKLESRVTSQHRVDMGKLSCVESFREYNSTRNHVAFPDSNCITIDTTMKTPDECVLEIAERSGMTGNS